MTNFGDFVRAKRTTAGLSMRALAEKTGFTAAYISDMENHKRLPNRPETIRRLADGIGVEYFELSAIVAHERESPEYDAEVPDEQLAIARMLATSKVTSEQLQMIRSAIASKG